MRHSFKKLLGCDGETEEKLQEKSDEAHAIKNKMQKDILG